jgi:hypothetical protein
LSPIITKEQEASRSFSGMIIKVSLAEKIHISGVNKNEIMGEIKLARTSIY